MRLAEVLAVSGLAKKAPFHLLPAGSEYQGAHCRFISQAELQIWLNERKQPEFPPDEQERGIYLPDVYASYFYFCEQQHNYISTLAYMRMINDLLPLEIENYELAFAAFVLLHEYGHWLHFRRCHKSGLDYVLWLNKFLAPVERQREILDLLPNTEPVKEALVAEHIDVYNAMPQELSANKYALKHVAGLYAKLIK